MIIFDTETTKLIDNTLQPLKLQPKIIEFSALKIDDQSLEVIGELDQLLDPKETLIQEVKDVTHIDDDMLKGQPTFPEFLPQLEQFFLGQEAMVAHNLGFDRSVMFFELKRLDRVWNFPWPHQHICSVERTEHLCGRRLSLTDLHKHLFNEEFPEAHRAMHDVQALYKCYRELVERKLI